MRVFIDTEFLNRGAGHPIDLISIGLVAETGEEFYGLNVDMPLGAMIANRWIRDNLWSTLPLTPLAEVNRGILDFDHEHPDIANVYQPANLREKVYDFLVRPDWTDTLELWGSYSGFDYVVLSQLFGTFDDTRAGIPMFIHDVQQVLCPAFIDLNTSLYGERPRMRGQRHNALDDARHVKQTFDWMFNPLRRGEEE